VCSSDLHVDDLVRAIELAITSPQASGQTYIVAHPRTYSGAELDRALRRCLGSRIPKWSLPASLLRQLGGYGDIIGRLIDKPCPMNSEVVSALLESACYSSEKLARELGWCAEIDLAEGLREMFG
jgi:nucleoside-diphosphate-sugar epimerase